MAIVINSKDLSETLWSDLLDEVHDRYFDLTQVQFDVGSGDFHLYLGDNRKGPYDKKNFQVTGVNKVDINDEAEIQFYMLFSPEIDPSSLKLKLPANGLDIELHLRPDWEIILTQKTE